MSFLKMIAIAFMLAFVVPFFVYLFSRLQMTAWLNAVDTWITKKGESDLEEEE